MEKDCTITSSSPYSFPAGFGADALQQEHYRSPTNVRTLTPNSNEQRQGIIVAMVSCLLLFLTAYGMLGLVQQIGTCRGEAPPSCCARPFCRLKAPLGLLLLRYASQTRTCRGKAPPSCCARPFCRLKAPLGLSLFRFAPQTRICGGKKHDEPILYKRV